MFEHSIKLVWNRRRTNRLVVVEIAAAFVVTFVLVALAVDLWSNYRRPLGFEYADVWSVAVVNQAAGGPSFDFSRPPPNTETLEDIVSALRRLDAAVAVEPIRMAPWGGGQMMNDFRDASDGSMNSYTNIASADALRTVGVTLVDGRWFGPEDEGQDYTPALVNRMFAERAYGSAAETVGRRIDYRDPDFPFEQLPERERALALREVRVVGVIDDFRQLGELTEPVPYVITQTRFEDGEQWFFSLLMKVAPGTDAGFEERIVEAVDAVAPGWVAQITPWEWLREQSNDRTLLPIKAAATIAAFFIALVVMGLTGVLWQEVVRRTQEIGLRRALGAPAGSVRGQIQLEMLIVGAFGILIGAGVAVQFPLLELVARIDWAAAVPALALSSALILALVALGALYPSWLASRREPADALRYE